MSVDRKIRVFRSDDQQSKKEKTVYNTPTKSASNNTISRVHLVKSISPQGQKKPEKSRDNQERHTNSLTPKTNDKNHIRNLNQITQSAVEEIRVTHQLILDEKQKAWLEKLFSAPEHSPPCCKDIQKSS